MMFCHRKAPYAPDRMIWQRIGMELFYRSITANLNVAFGTVHNINRLFIETGDGFILIRNCSMWQSRGHCNIVGSTWLSEVANVWSWLSLMKLGVAAKITLVTLDMLSVIDETGCSSKDHTRNFGYALLGEASVEHRWLHRGTKVSAIAAITTEMLAVELVTGATFFFLLCVEPLIIPEMLPFDGKYPTSNAVSVRKRKRTRTQPKGRIYWERYGSPM